MSIPAASGVVVDFYDWQLERIAKRLGTTVQALELEWLEDIDRQFESDPTWSDAS